jgi:hypothetical protein
MPGMKLLPLLALLLTAPLYAGEVLNPDFVEREPAAREELGVVLPAWPAAPDLVSFDVSGVAPHFYAIDLKSISVGRDAIVRYTLYVKTRGGSLNVSYEGMRCETAQRKIYALGQADKTWERTRAPQWQDIRLRSLLSVHKALYEDILCPDGLPVRDATEVKRLLDNLRRGSGWPSVCSNRPAGWWSRWAVRW